MALSRNLELTVGDSYILPNAEQTADMVGMLYGTEIGVEITDDSAFTKAYSATYIDKQDQLVALCECNPEMVIYGGAALSMLPPGGARDMLADGEYSKTVLDNFHEVMNVCSRLMMSDSSAHLRLQTIYPSADIQEAAGQFQSQARAIMFAIDIPKYGIGKMRFLVK